MNIENLDSGLNHLKTIENQLFTAKKVPLVTGIEGYEAINAYGVFKENPDGGGTQLGIVGKDFNPPNLQRLFDSLTESLLMFDTPIDLDKLQFIRMKSDQKVRFSVPLKSIEYTNLRGQNDKTIINLNLQTGFDGLTKTTLYLSCLRLVCTNGMRAISREINISAKNTFGNEGKIELFTKEITNLANDIDSLEKMHHNWNKKEITQKDIDKFLMTVIGMDSQTYKDKATQSQNKFAAIMHAIQIEQNDCGNNALSLVNGITRYTNHMVKNKDAQTYLYCDSGLMLNNKAQTAANQLCFN